MFGELAERKKRPGIWELRVKRSDGNIDEGWSFDLNDFNIEKPNSFRVTKSREEGELEKTISLKNILEANDLDIESIERLIEILKNEADRIMSLAGLNMEEHLKHSKQAEEVNKMIEQLESKKEELLSNQK